MKKTIISLHKIYSEDAIELDSILFEPSKPTKSVVIHIHGKEGHFLQNHFVSTLGYALAENGISFLSFNNRGHDYVADMLHKTHGGFEFVMRGSAYDILSEAPRDINGVIAYLKEMGYEKIILQGHSLGPHKICYYMTHEPRYDIDGIILLSASDIKYLFNAYVPNWLDNRAIAQQLVKDDKGEDLMPIRLWSNALVSAKTYLDWTRDDADSWIFNFSDPAPVFKYFRDIKIPIIMVNPENDVAVNTKQSEIGKMLKKATISKDFAFHSISNAPHNFAGKDQELADILIPWVQKRTLS
ncbi:MAG: DUF1749 domain-containing protein [Candidatus Roizmanbacteria bacterium]